VLLSWMRSDLSFDRDSAGVNFTPFKNVGTQDSDSFTGTLFAAWNLDESLYVDAHFGAGYTDYDLKRNVVFQESTRTTPQTNIRTRSDTDGYEISTGGRIGYDLALGSAVVGPYARIQYARAEIGAHREKGGNGLAMRFQDETRKSLTTALGANASYALSFDFGVVVPQLRAEWEHEYERDAEVLSSSYPLDLDDNQFRNRSDSPDRDFVNLGAGVAAVLPGGWMPYVDYQTLLFYRDWERHQLTAGIRKEF
jgi:outer membrane autotransporter protein